jgi:hypothetical protein
MLILLLVAELGVLYLLSRKLNQMMFLFWYLLTRSKHSAMSITTLILFPGTVVHELSHLFTAEILGVRTGKLTLIPKWIDGDNIHAGSVQVAHTDPFRRAIIGLSPMFVGIAAITFLSIHITNMIPQMLPIQNKPETYLVLLLGYLLFAISNNMFSSKEDLYGVPPVLIVLGLMLGATYAIGFRLELTGAILNTLQDIVKTLAVHLGIVLGINAILLFLLYLLISIFRPGNK